MTQPSKLWRIAAALFVIINVAGAGYAIAMGERPHALTHVALLVVGFIGWQFAPWKRRQTPAPDQLPDARLDYLQQSVDAVALEVERLGEAQRFADKLRAEQGQAPPVKKPPEV
jgi:hypothetical protein